MLQYTDKREKKKCTVVQFVFGYTTVLLLASLVLLVVMVLTGCQHKGLETKYVNGVLEGPIAADSVPARVLEAMERAERYHQHDLMSDTIASVAVFSIDEADTTSTEGFGIVVTKGAVSTTFPHIRNVRQPRACYDREKGNLWLTSSQMEGTGVAVERPYLVRFGENDIAYIAATIDPYDMQQALCQRLRYAVEGREVTLYDGDQHLVTVVVNETNMGDLYEDAVWIGEQLTYEADSDGLTVCVTPGLSFNTGLVLHYGEGSPRSEAPQAISTYEYDGQGRMISHTFAYEKKDYDWQDGDMLTVTNYEWQNDNIHTVTVLNEEGAVKSVRTYEPSDITADRVIPVDFNDCEDWLAAYGFFGKTSRFLPASESIKVYAKDKLFTVEDIQFTYVITDGLVTTISQKIENNIILLNKASSTEYETTVEWK